MTAQEQRHALDKLVTVGKVITGLVFAEDIPTELFVRFLRVIPIKPMSALVSYKAMSSAISATLSGDIFSVNTL